MKLTDLPSKLNAAQTQLRAQVSNWTVSSVTFRVVLILIAAGLGLLCLMLLGGCAVNPPGAPQIQPCRVPEARLQPTPEPLMRDATGKELVKEAGELRQSLRLANADKASVLEFIQNRCTPQPQKGE